MLAKIVIYMLRVWKVWKWNITSINEGHNNTMFYAGCFFNDIMEEGWEFVWSEATPRSINAHCILHLTVHRCNVRFSHLGTCFHVRKNFIFKNYFERSAHHLIFKTHTENHQKFLFPFSLRFYQIVSYLYIYNKVMMWVKIPANECSCS